MTTKKIFVWFYMLSKRLVKRWSFIVILLAIPFSAWGVHSAVKGESGVLTIYLCAEKNNSHANEIIDYIKNTKTSLLFKRSSSLEDSLWQLKHKKADAVWYFEGDFYDMAKQYAKGTSTAPFVKVFEREDTIPLKLSREKLYGGIHKKLAYFMCRNFVYSELADKNEISEEMIKEYIQKRNKNTEPVVMEYSPAAENTDAPLHLVMPIRGILSLFVVVGGLTAASVFVNDQKKGRFAGLASQKHIIAAFGQCFAGTLLTAVAVLVALRFSGVWLGFLKEVFFMLLFVIASSGFCLNLCAVFKSPVKLVTFIPPLVVIMLFLSPIFFDINVLRSIKLTLPTYHYLQSLSAGALIHEFAFYIICIYFSSWLIFKMK